MEKKILITSAGLATAVNVIKALRDSNFYQVEIHCIDQSVDAAGLYLADYFKTSPSISDPLYLEFIISYCIRNKIDFIFPLLSKEIIFFSKNIDKLHEQNIKLSISTPEVIENCNNKSTFINKLKEFQMPFPRTFFSTNEIDSFPVFIKPIFGSSASDTHKINSKEELLFFYKSNIHIIQEYIDWKEVTVDCFVTKKSQLIGCVPRYRIKIKDGKAVVAQTFSSPFITNQIIRLLTLFKVTGPCNVQLFYNGQDQIKFIEINPRLSAGGLPLTVQAGINIPELMIQDEEGKTSNDLLPYNKNLKMIRYLAELFI